MTPRPQVAMSFSPTSINFAGNSRMTLTISPGSLATLTAIGFSDTLPAGIGLSNATVQSCGGVEVQVSGDRRTLSLSGATLGPKQICTLSYSVFTGVTNASIGDHVNEVTVNSSAGPVTVKATLTVSFDPQTIPLDGTSQMTLRVQESGNSINYVNFVDTLPPGIEVATPKQMTSSGCGSCLSASGNTVQLGNTELKFRDSCVVKVNVTGKTPGVLTNQLTVNSQASTLAIASASLTVGTAPPRPQVAMSFSPASINFAGSSRMTLTIMPGSLATLAAVGFSDALPSGIQAQTNGAVQSCGGGMFRYPGMAGRSA